MQLTTEKVRELDHNHFFPMGGTLLFSLGSNKNPLLVHVGEMLQLHNGNKLEKTYKWGG